MGLIMKKDKNDWDEQLKKALVEDGGKTEDEASDMVNNKDKYLAPVQATNKKPKLAQAPDEIVANAVSQETAKKNYFANGGDSTLTDKQKTVLTTGQSSEKQSAVQNALNNANIVDLLKASYSGSLRRSPLSGVATPKNESATESTSTTQTVRAPAAYGTGIAWGSKRNTGDVITDEEKDAESSVTAPAVSKKTDGISSADIGLGEAAKEEDSSESNLPSGTDAEELIKQFFDQYFGSESYTPSEAPEQQYYQGTAAPEATPYEGLTDEEIAEIKNQLQQQSEQTAEDVMGKYASMTGGVPSTAAVSQAAASGADVMSKLYDLLEAKDESKYNRWRTDYNDQYSRWQTQDATDYNRWKYDQDTAYDRWQDQESLASAKADSDSANAYNKLTALMGLYGYGDSSSGSSSSSSSSASYPDTTLGSISSATGVSADSIPNYSTWIKGYGSKIAADTVDEETGDTKSAAEALASMGVKKLMEDLEANYPDDFIYRAAAIIDYMYENAAITGAERERWLIQSGLKALADKMSGSAE